MDKNMINIDDLVRQRLNGGEEQERSGAWLRMKDMLDEKMPTRVPAVGFNWRRMLSATAVLLVLAVVGIGGSQYLTSQRGDAITTDNSMAIAANTAGTSTATGAATPAAASEGTTTGGSITAVSGGDDNKNTKTVTAEHTYASAAHGGVTPTKNSNVAETATDMKNKPAIKKGFAKDGKGTHKPGPADQNVNTTAPGNTNTAQATNNTNNTNNNTLTNDQKNTTASANTTAANNNTKAHNIAKKANNTGNKLAAVKNNNIIPSSGKIAAAKNTPVLKPASTNNTAASKSGPDSMDKIVVKGRDIVDHRTNTAKVETVVTEVSKVPVARAANESNNYLNPRYVPEAANNPQAVNTVAAATPATAKPVPAAKTGGDLTIAKKSSKRSSGWDFSGVNDMLRNAKDNLSQVQFVGGITGGFNATFFAPDKLFGFQLGLTGALQFNEHWGIGAEIKYMMRFNRGLQLNNNYMQYTQTGSNTTGGVTTYNYAVDSMEDYFTYTTMHSFELPLSLRFTTNKVTVFGGGNFAYNLAIQNEEVTQKWPEAGVTTTSQIMTSTGPKVTSNDFGSRFSIGYIVGASYKITPSFSLDARVTQSLWDNAKTTGAKQISKDLYRNPSLQLSIGYRFGRDKKTIR